MGRTMIGSLAFPQVRAVVSDVAERARAVSVEETRGPIVLRYGRGAQRRAFPAGTGTIVTFRAPSGATLRVGAPGSGGGQIQEPIVASDSRDMAALIMRALQQFYAITLPVEFRANAMTVVREMHDKHLLILREVQSRDGSFELHRPSQAMAPGAGRTDTAAFRAWFGASRVVTPTGEPLVVYHGTRESFHAFALEKRGAATAAPSAGEGFFFSRRPHTAASYTNLVRPGEQAEHDQLFKAKRYAEAAEMRQAGGNVMPVYLRIENPLIVDQKGKGYRETSYFELIQKARAGGHDGLIIRNTYDAVLGDALPDDIYVAFDPRQVKSVFNRGEWNRDSALLLHGLFR